MWCWEKWGVRACKSNHRGAKPRSKHGEKASGVMPKGTKLHGTSKGKGVILLLLLSVNHKKYCMSIIVVVTGSLLLSHASSQILHLIE